MQTFAYWFIIIVSAGAAAFAAWDYIRRKRKNA